jgi:hypothetical protein
MGHLFVRARGLVSDSDLESREGTKRWAPVRKRFSALTFLLRFCVKLPHYRNAI